MQLDMATNISTTGNSFPEVIREDRVIIDLWSVIQIAFTE